MFETAARLRDQIKELSN
ncbi:UvrB/UvrC motif-containing protein [Candidatus Daviesbacteria bacterium]|nr:UvrB/UvrC motif-containing protein [Candidatus Daviesbacteria bacterium]